MSKKSAGILLYRINQQQLEVMLVHPGGPFWVNKDAGAWSIPKGEFDDEEEPLAAALREFYEETGTSVTGNFIPLTPVNQNRKIVYAFALEKDFDTSTIKSNTFMMEWPPKSGKQQAFPEIDKADWFDLPTAQQKINRYQATILDELAGRLNLPRE